MIRMCWFLSKSTFMEEKIQYTWNVHLTYPLARIVRESWIEFIWSSVLWATFLQLNSHWISWDNTGYVKTFSCWTFGAPILAILVHIPYGCCLVVSLKLIPDNRQGSWGTGMVFRVQVPAGCGCPVHGNDCHVV